MRITYGVLGSAEPSEIEIRINAGRREAVLRKNIVHDWHDVEQDSEHEPIEFWKWDQLDELFTELDEGELAESAEILWYQAEREAMGEAEWRADIEATLTDLMLAAVEE